ncbi:Leucine-, isoleucine-, valine-, threonine-, and alanine-binding protein [bioreactor metagenome]|mgnify:CR=1 FL=1|jgi:branched-chain amino acid transport system substrate-binding protein|uniref:Leucine-, isoleucine-, valine-, threonine-, and alanine-binding protein n=1 Tax=bioreactor metagenome TaxID=1076179 RepID=A0A644SWW1_9ZZZZ
MRMTTKKAGLVLGICCVALFLALLAGCGGGQSGKTVKIALQAPITGDYAYEGQMAKQSVEVAAELINKAGGLLGKQVEILIVDDASNPKDSALAAQKAVSQKAAAVIGSYGSSVTEPAADIYEKNKIVSVGYGCTAVRLTMDKERKYFFRTCGRDDAQGLFFGKYAVETMGAKRIAIMHDNSTFAKGVADEAMKALEPYVAQGKTEVVYFDAVTPKEKDFSAAVTKLRETKPDVWYFTGYYPEAGLLIRQARDAGLDCPFIGGNAAINDDFVKIAGLDVAAGALMTQEPLVTDVTTDIASQFKALYAEKFKELPSSPWPVYAADALYAIAGAIDKAGKLDSDAIAEAMRGRMEGVQGVTGALLFTDRGDRRDVPYKMYKVDPEGKLVVAGL